MVMLAKEPRHGKWDDTFVGPYEILEVLESRNVRLEIDESHTKVVHVDKLKKACDPLIFDGEDNSYDERSSSFEEFKKKGGNR
ncbi:hypothetical protein DD595_26380 [Enterobacter cloacae complex sp. 4DZ3-17B2]|nr:hypothetical protein DD595_26380 [Enterobacter cloacae complex sp. 4DZ3-17B2]